MITKFKNFINEFHSYTGPFGSTGFKLSNPTNKYRLILRVEYKPENEEFFKNILDKYTIPFDEDSTSLTIEERKKSLIRKSTKTQLLDITFFAYNIYEANAIIDTIFKEIVDSKLKFDPSSFEVEPSVDIKMNKEKLIGFGR